MLNADSGWLAHSVQNLALIALSIALLPFDTFILLASYLLSGSRGESHLRQRHAVRQDPTFQRRTILVTGVGMTKGLALARLFYQAGHNVIGADFEPGRALVCGRVSKAVSKFYRLQAPSVKGGSAPYIQGLVDIVKDEKVDLWVSCSGVASAVEDGMAMQVVEAKTSCKAVQFDAKTTQMLHEKHSFIQRTKELGLPTPETHEITSREQVEDVLARAPKSRKYIMKTIGVDDSMRADMTLLPKDNRQETSQHIAKLKISETTPWIIQQFIDGLEFCTHSLVVRGEVKAFVACPSAELLMHYEALPPDSALSRAMLSFTRRFADESGASFTGHLSFDFLVERDDLTKLDPRDITLYPIECNPRAHTAVALFNDTTEMARAYLTVLDSTTTTTVKPSYADVVDPDPTRKVITPRYSAKYYWTGHDLVALLLLPFLDVLLLRRWQRRSISVVDLVRALDVLLDHLVFWTDGTWAVWDPLPWWWLYHVYWPLRFWHMFCTRRKWSRVNVSTGKMFEC